MALRDSKARLGLAFLHIREERTCPFDLRVSRNGADSDASLVYLLRPEFWRGATLNVTGHGLRQERR